jgi:hypothetical protein
MTEASHAETLGIMIVVPSSGHIDRFAVGGISDGGTLLRADRFPRPNDLSLTLRTLGI